MAAHHIALGKRGEQLAAEFLQELGCEILVRNYRWSRAEVDIIARRADTIHFVEVKTRMWYDEEAAAHAVDAKKQRNVMAAAGRYCDDEQYGGDIQFDVVTVLLDANGVPKISWREDAFGFFN